jgi:hypothetical protein
MYTGGASHSLRDLPLTRYSTARARYIPHFVQFVYSTTLATARFVAIIGLLDIL